MGGVFYKKLSSQMIIKIVAILILLDLFLPLNFSLRASKAASFYKAATGYGEGKMAGYYGWVIDRSNFPEYQPHTRLKVLSSADIHETASVASASGYETLLVTDPPEYDPSPPRVVVRDWITLYPGRVQVCFIIIVDQTGYLGVNVNSDYYLRDDWMRIVFARMLLDIHLPTDILSRFELAVNRIITWREP